MKKINRQSLTMYSDGVTSICIRNSMQRLELRDTTSYLTLVSFFQPNQTLKKNSHGSAFSVVLLFFCCNIALVVHVKNVCFL